MLDASGASEADGAGAVPSAMLGADGAGGADDAGAKPPLVSAAPSGNRKRGPSKRDLWARPEFEHLRSSLHMVPDPTF